MLGWQLALLGAATCTRHPSRLETSRSRQGISAFTSCRAPSFPGRHGQSPPPKAAVKGTSGGGELGTAVKIAAAPAGKRCPGRLDGMFAHQERLGANIRVFARLNSVRFYRVLTKCRRDDVTLSEGLKPTA